MAKIRVNRSEFNKAASKIGTHLMTVRAEMMRAKILKLELKGGWEGKDELLFESKFDDLTKKGSTYDNYIKTLEGYQSFINNANELYRKAQEDAYNLARKI